MTNIEWTDSTWNPVIGCAKVAQGCRNCYAETMSKRLAAMGQKDYASILMPDGKFNGHAIARPDTLAQPLRWKKPRMVFVNSMSDLFHEDVPFEFIAAVFGVIAACPQHTFQVLTKRPERALEFFEWVASGDLGKKSAMGTALLALAKASPELAGKATKSSACLDTPWPLKNVWLGVSVATQADAEKNIPVLLKCPATIRFVSAEPLVEAVDLLSVWEKVPLRGDAELSRHALVYVDWVIVGGESGPNARPCDVAWIRSIVQQCKAAGVACFVKQLGAVSVEVDQPMNSTIRRDYLDRKGGDHSEWPDDLRVRQFPEASHA
jgi:protein gp37